MEEKSVPLTTLLQHPEAMALMCTGLLNEGKVEYVEGLLESAPGSVFLGRQSVYSETHYAKLLRSLVRHDALKTLSRWLQEDAKGSGEEYPHLKELMLCAARWKSQKVFDYLLGKNIRKSKLVMFELFYGGGAFAAQRIKNPTYNEAVELLNKIGSLHGGYSRAPEGGYIQQEYVFQVEDIDFLLAPIAKEMRRQKDGIFFKEFQDQLYRFVGGLYLGNKMRKNEERCEQAQVLIEHLVESAKRLGLGFSTVQLGAALTQSALAGSARLVQFFSEKIKEQSGYANLSDALAHVNQQCVIEKLEPEVRFASIDVPWHEKRVMLRSEHPGILNMVSNDYMVSMEKDGRTVVMRSTPNEIYFQSRYNSYGGMSSSSYYEHMIPNNNKYRYQYLIEPFPLMYAGLLGQSVPVCEYLQKEGLPLIASEKIDTLKSIEHFNQRMGNKLYLESVKSFADVVVLKEEIKERPKARVKKAGGRL